MVDHRPSAISSREDSGSPRPRLDGLSVGLRGERALAPPREVVAVGAHYAGPLIARDLGDGGADIERRFSFVVVSERDSVLRAARSLMLSSLADSTSASTL